MICRDAPDLLPGSAPPATRVRLRLMGKSNLSVASEAFVGLFSRRRRQHPTRPAVYVAYMAPRAQYVRPPRLSSGSGGSRGSSNPVSPLFSTCGRSPNPTLSDINKSFQVNDLQSANG
jgi:hypothetical protein